MTRSSARWLAVLVGLGLGQGVAACEPTREELQELIAESRGCAADEECVLAGGSQCTCDQPVNAQRAAEVKALAARVQCGGVTVRCAAFADVRCEAGQCTGD